MIVHLNGWPDTGRFTVGRLVANCLGARFVHNHVLHDVAIACAGYDDPERWRLYEDVRKAAYEVLLGWPDREVVVLTNALCTNSPRERAARDYVVKCALRTCRRSDSGARLEHLVLITLRPATDADRPFLAWLEEACMRDYAVALWGAWRPESEETLSIEGHRLVAGGRGVGCIAVFQLPDHVWVDKLYVAPDFQNRRFGTAALGVVLADAARDGVPVRLSVLTTNPALAFYRRHGFRVDDETAERRYLTTSRPE